ncbi:MAG: hypothetical protein J6R37_04870 [Clostridia bacterium]|nr:hypothetical protein [Clostridia bacterium]
MVDYKLIKLENERSTHLTKRLNRLSLWQFFKVLYRDSMGRMLLTNFLLLLALTPLAVAVIYFYVQINNAQYALPYYNTLGAGNGIWIGVYEHFDALQTAYVDQCLTWCLLAFLGISIILSGGFAVVRDSFWTGKIKIRAFFGGLKANVLYALATSAIIGGALYGIVVFCLKCTLPTWAVIVLAILMSLVLLLVACFLFILCSVSVTYKQSLKQNVKDSFRLLWLNPIPNLIHETLMLLPIPVIFWAATAGQLLMFVVYMFVFFIGAFYFAFVWQTHMMKTFALFHPVAGADKK